VSSKALVLGLLLGVLLGWLLPCAHAQETKRHVLIASYSKGEVSYTLDGRAPESNEGLLLALGRARSGRDTLCSTHTANASGAARPFGPFARHWRGYCIPIS
jgi:hypothetical protein